MRRALVGVVLVVAAMLLAAPLAHAQDDKLAPYLGRPVAAVTFDIEGRRDTSPQLLTLVDVKVGQPLRREDLRTSQTRLLTAGRFENVFVLIGEAAGGIEVIFRLLPIHPINDLQVTIVGDSALVPGDLERRFRDDYGGLPTVARVAAAENTLRKLLVDDGYLDAVVVSEIVPVHDPDGATLVFTVRPGSLVNVGAIVLQNTSPLPDAELVKAAGVRVGEPFRAASVQRAMASVQDDLRRRGFYEAIAASTWVQRQDHEGVEVTLVVNGGPRVDLRVIGELPGRREDLIPFEREGSVDDDVLDASRERIKAAFKRRGHNDGDAPYTREVQPDGSLLITFTAQPGPRYRIGNIVIPDDLAVPPREFEKLFGVKVGEEYNEVEIMRGLQRVLAQLARLGYYQATGAPIAEFALGAPGDDASAVVRLDITQGPKGVVGDIIFAFKDQRSGVVTDAELRAAMVSKTGQPFVSANVGQDVFVVENVYRNKGFRSATAEIKPGYNEDGTRVTLNVSIVEGLQIFIGSIVVVGNRSVSEASIREQIPLRVGEPFSEAAQLEANNLLRARGVFRRVTVQEEPRLVGETLATVVISVEESPANSVGVGGGLEVARRVRTAPDGTLDDTFDFAPRGFVDLSRRNLGGRNRQVNFFARASLRRRNVPDDPLLDASGLELSEYRVSATFRERLAFNTNTDVLVGVTTEQANRTTFSFVREAGNVDILRRLSPRVSLSGRYVLDYTELFDERIPEDERPTIDRFFPQVRLSIVSTGVLWDRRDNPLTPTRGTQSSVDVEMAARSIGSEIGYVKLFTQLAGYQAAPTFRTIIAGRVQVGIARGFKRLAVLTDNNGKPVLDPEGNPVTGVVEDLPASQRFFAGGASSVRGFQTDRLGVSEIVNDNGLSVGGNGLLVLNAEIRRIVGKLWGRNFSAVGFVDGGNVFARASDLDVTRLRAALGFGVRYDSPLGPVRLDFGFKTKRLFYGNGTRERGWEYHLSIGEAF
ncbi:MAG TPA: POTRA domain-containing protein [Vicinamibacterales bacterium]|nr:POTRA domain-containing protein [Vicinamibacterales bacterium]